MNTFYLEFKPSISGVNMLHRFGCKHMPKIDYCLFIGSFCNENNVKRTSQEQFPSWEIERSECCRSL
ncbi:hypothetical protein [Carboxylicivirga sp. N1Y90]|uniref:hypothetical protein n=1 Tax=Carboxylicivirga fragile TaxID=3417571 RepID=UPI003D34C5B7|nr:hypothetical protein [Marinilabiliaceae bacterium N1Y90]